ncbi:MAG: dTDP-4-amino-4,6-dideoxygalactose transaminase [Maricaulis sp.]|nr:dTDP-4-amino-4,6-dideoxygalactose transaminase [Maricaulis sp.]
MRRCSICNLGTFIISHIIPFNRSYITGLELKNIALAQKAGALSGDGKFSRECERLLEITQRVPRSLVTHSCTAALEMAAILLELRAGDEVIMPSYTFVSTANAVAMRGAVPVFVDIRPDTLNIDETLIEAAITSKTKSIWVVHYAGVACEMDAILKIATKYGLSVVEDAAQALRSTYKNKPLGGLGDFGALSFHETKNITCGEGGALLIRDLPASEQAEIVHQKGTDRRRFMSGKVDKYTWQTVGSSYLLGELASAYLRAQLEHADDITEMRRHLWRRYHEALAPVARSGLISRPSVPDHCVHNAHMYYVVLADGIDRSAVLAKLNAAGIGAVFHYVPLHSSPAGARMGRAAGLLKHTDAISAGLIRLPLWAGLSELDQDRVIAELGKVLTD